MRNVIIIIITFILCFKLYSSTLPMTQEEWNNLCGKENINDTKPIVNQLEALWNMEVKNQKDFFNIKNEVNEIRSDSTLEMFCPDGYKQVVKNLSLFTSSKIDNDKKTSINYIKTNLKKHNSKNKIKTNISKLKNIFKKKKNSNNGPSLELQKKAEALKFLASLEGKKLNDYIQQDYINLINENNKELRRIEEEERTKAFANGSITKENIIKECSTSNLSDKDASLLLNKYDTLKGFNLRSTISYKDSVREMQYNASELTRSIESKCPSSTLMQNLVNKTQEHVIDDEFKYLKKKANEVVLLRSPSKEIDKMKFLEMVAKRAFRNKIQIKSPNDYISKEDTKELYKRGMENQLELEKKCSTVDLRNSPGIQGVRNQTATGWCFAYTATDLLSFKEGRTFSALDTASKYYDRFYYAISGKNYKELNKIGGGFVEHALKEQLNSNKGLCPESELSSQTKNASDYIQILDNLESILKETRIRKKSSKYTPSCIPAPASNLGEVFKNVSINDIFLTSTKSSLKKFWRNLVNKNCRDKRVHLSKKYKLKVVGRKISKFKYKRQMKNKIKKNDQDGTFYGIGSGKERDYKQFADAIHEQLSKNNIIAIDYDSNVLRDKEIDPSKKPGWHASTIVGRKFNKSRNQCEYIVKNSWGEDCKDYHNSYSCEKGKIFVPEEDLIKSISRVTYLE